MAKLLINSAFLFALLFTGCSITNIESGIVSTISNKGKLLKEETFSKEPIVINKNDKKFYCFEMTNGKYDCFNKNKTLLYTTKNSNVYTVKKYTNIIEIYLPKKEIN